MRRFDSLARTVLASLLLGAGIALPQTAAAEKLDAGENRNLVAVGEVSSKVTRPEMDVRSVLRKTLAEELPSVDLSRARHRPVILSVSLLQMQTESTKGSSSTHCVVSATLRTKQGNNLFAVLEGRAYAEDAAKERNATEQAALRRAMQGALARLPEALAQ